MKAMLKNVFLQLLFAEIMNAVNSGSVPTSILVVFKTLVAAHMYAMHSTSFVHRFLKLKEVDHYPKQSFGLKSMLQRVSIVRFGNHE